MEEYKTLTEESFKEAIEEFIKENWQSILKVYKWKDGADCEAYMFNLPSVSIVTGKEAYKRITNVNENVKHMNSFWTIAAGLLFAIIFVLAIIKYYDNNPQHDEYLNNRRHDKC